ncbi:MAG: hypothetical protein JJT94_09260 [Bernardetiaceae bacterium]|nr:hypothetical protein [Bernardetiaceae bacterium]
MKFLTSIITLFIICIMITTNGFAQNAAQILTSTPWRYDAEKLKESFQAQFGNMSESNMSAEQRAAKEQAENQVNVMKDLRLHFGANNQLAIKYYGSEQGVMQWNVSGNTLIMSQQGESQSFDILKISANELHIREKQTGEESFLLAEGYNRPSANAGSPQKGGDYKVKMINHMAYEGQPAGDVVVAYQGSKLIIKLANNTTICECEVESNNKEGYETGTCEGEIFNLEKGLYIKDKAGNIIIGSANRSTTRFKRIALFSVDENTLDKHNGSEAFKKMIKTLAGWHGVSE